MEVNTNADLLYFSYCGKHLKWIIISDVAMTGTHSFLACLVVVPQFLQVWGNGGAGQLQCLDNVTCQAALVLRHKCVSKALVPCPSSSPASTVLMSLQLTSIL